MATRNHPRVATAAPARATTANNTLENGYWNEDVMALEDAIGELIATRPLSNDCHVSFFEVDGDTDLHVNVTHRYQTASAKGWSGPAIMPDGYVHNRRFRDRQAIFPHIRDMVLAPRI